MPEQDLASLVGAQKATSIGPPQPGTRLQPTPTDGPLTTLARWLVGEMRPTSVVAQDPYGITGWERGAGQPPIMFGTTDAGGPGMLDALAQKFPRLANAIKAYHGSPHDFESFDLSKIGTGEGAQAYGHGLYFAENPQVAQEYRRQLAKDQIKVGDRVFDPGELSEHIWRSSGNNSSTFLRGVMDAVEEFRVRGKNSPGIVDTPVSDLPAMFGQTVEQREGYRYAVKQLIAASKPGGKMYEVAIHADPDQFLDWDKPLSQQSEAVKKQLQAWMGPNATSLSGREIYHKLGQYDEMVNVARGAGADNAGRRLRQVFPQASEQEIAQAIVRANGPDSTPMAAALLHERGIPGIKYLDQGSRAAGQGSYNYVVFDDKLIEIMKKYGVGLAVAQQIYQRQQQEQGK